MKRVVSGVLLAMLGLLVTSFTSADIKVNDEFSSPTIYLDAPRAVLIYENFTVSIKVSNVVDMCGWQVKLKWDPGLM